MVSDRQVTRSASRLSARQHAVLCALAAGRPGEVSALVSPKRVERTLHALERRLLIVSTPGGRWVLTEAGRVVAGRPVPAGAGTERG